MDELIDRVAEISQELSDTTLDVVIVELRLQRLLYCARDCLWLAAYYITLDTDHAGEDFTIKSQIEALFGLECVILTQTTDNRLLLVLQGTELIPDLIRE